MHCLNWHSDSDRHRVYIKKKKRKTLPENTVRKLPVACFKSPKLPISNKQLKNRGRKRAEILMALQINMSSKIKRKKETGQQ